MHFGVIQSGNSKCTSKNIPVQPMFADLNYNLQNHITVCSVHCLYHAITSLNAYHQIQHNTMKLIHTVGELKRNECCLYGELPFPSFVFISFFLSSIYLGFATKRATSTTQIISYAVQIHRNDFYIYINWFTFHVNYIKQLLGCPVVFIYKDFVIEYLLLSK